MNLSYLPLRLLFFSFLISLSSVAIVETASAQCSAGDHTFTTQAQVDNFVSSHSGCSSLTVGNLVIGYESGEVNSNITNIAALSNITTVTGDLIIRRNPALTTLNGLQNITSFNGNLRIDNNATLTTIAQLTGITDAKFLNIRNNNALETLSGLQNLTQLSSYLYIRANAKLVNTNALSNLSSVGSYIEIYDNDLLTNLNGLSGIATINGHLVIHENAVLENIQGLKNIAASSIAGTGLTITNNPNLAVCNLANFCTYLSGTGTRNITGNKTTCLTDVAVITVCNDPIVTIPDANFKNYLISNTEINTNGDSEIQVSEAQAFTGGITCSGLNIADLTGIEAFVNITRLECNNNQLTALDVSQNKSLTHLYCYNNQIASLDVSSNHRLKILSCEENQLTSLDVSNNILLDQMNCSDNLLSTLNLQNGNNSELDFMTATNNPRLNCIMVDNVANANAKPNWQKAATVRYAIVCLPAVYIPDANFKAFLLGNTNINTNRDSEIQVSEAKLYTGVIYCANLNIADLTGIEAFENIKELWCNNNQLTALDLSHNKALRALYCNNNSISELDLSNNTELRELYCNSNLLTALDVSNIQNLVVVECNDNQLTALDLSQKKALAQLYCNNNQLTSLNLKNGHNGVLEHMRASGNANLECILVDNGANARAKANWQKDETAYYTTDCDRITNAIRILYVNKSVSGGNQTGSDWANAIPELADALKWAKEQYVADNSIFDDIPLKIFVATGTYKPKYRADNLDGSNSTDRENSFVMVKQVQLYGGFDPARGITDLSHKRIIPDENNGLVTTGTILSGDFKGDDRIYGSGVYLSLSYIGENAYHVVISAGDIGDALLNGFVIKGGNANNSDLSFTVNGKTIIHHDGGGIYASGSDVKISNVSIQGCFAKWGAGLYSKNGNHTIQHLLVDRNYATLGGGGIFNDTGKPIISYSNINNNKVSINSIHAGLYGGGIYNTNSSVLVLNHVGIIANALVSPSGYTRGGGMYNNNSHPILSNVTIRGNNLNSGGDGSIFNTDVSTGGGMYNWSSNPVLTNVIIDKNIVKATGLLGAVHGGGMANYYSSPVLVNTTIAFNQLQPAPRMSGSGAGMVSGASSNVKVYNSVFWGNHLLIDSKVSSSDINNNNSHSEIKSSITQDYTRNVPEDNILVGIDPMFENEANNDYRLKKISPAIGLGNNSFYSDVDKGNRVLANDFDAAGNARLYEANIDLGALEYNLSLLPDANNILYVNKTVSGGNGSGSSWDDAVVELSDALVWAKKQYDAYNTVFDATPLKIYVATGTYKPEYRADNLSPITPQDRNNAFVLVKNVQIYGGFDPATNIKTLEDKRKLPATVGAAGGTIVSGDIDDVPGISENDAQHILIAAGDVGAALLDGFTVSDGYISTADGSTSITVNNLPVRNERGSGMSLVNASPQVRNTLFTGNRAYAGVVAHTNSNAVFVNTLFTANTVQYGTVYNANSSPILVNSIIAGNTGFDDVDNGIGMRNVSISNPKISNSIIWGNQTANGIVNNISNSTGANASVPEYAYSLVQGITTTANGNLDGNTDPLFIDAANRDYRPEAGSPVINAGNNTYFEGLETGSRDLAGNPRLIRHYIDMGAYESDCNGAALVSDVEVTRPLTTGDNYLYSSCSPLAVVNPEYATGNIVVSAAYAGDLVSHDNARYVRRYYQLSAENTGNTEVTLFFTQADFDHYNSAFGQDSQAKLPDNLRIARYPDGYTLDGTALAFPDKPIYIEPSSAPQWNETLGLWEVRFTTPGFSGFFITGQSDNALPVTLVGFNAKVEEQSALLTWQTASEVNFSHFEPERSRDGKKWQKLEVIPATGGNERGAEYRYRDQSPLAGLSYYRLKLVDRTMGHGNGIHEYSAIRSVVLQKGSHRELLVYPNPATHLVHLEADAEIAEVLFWDITGRLVKKVIYREGAGVSLAGLGSGMLLIEARLSDGTSRTGPVVVQP